MTPEFNEAIRKRLAAKFKVCRTKDIHAFSWPWSVVTPAGETFLYTSKKKASSAAEQLKAAYSAVDPTVLLDALKAKDERISELETRTAQDDGRYDKRRRT